MRGAFITVEGIDRAGKGTHLDFIQQWLEDRAARVVRTREPGGTEAGEALRRILLEHDAPLSARAELMMIFAARAQHLDEVILPALADGACVLCDRFTDSTYAYQGGGRGIADEAIETLERWVQRDLQPDLTLLFDVPVEVGLARNGDLLNWLLSEPQPQYCSGAKSTSQNPCQQKHDRFECEAIEFHQAVRKAYLARAERFERIQTINSDQSISRVRADLIAALETFWRARESAQ